MQSSVDQPDDLEGCDILKLSIRFALVAFVAIALLTGVSLAVTSQSGFCASCHEMREDYAAWKASAHKKVSCVSCHIEPGAANFLSHKVSALKEVSAHISGNYENPINKGSGLSKSLPSSICTSCHKSPGKVSNKRVIMDHDSHKETGLGCAFCHNRVAHSGLKNYQSRINMASCVGCHKKEEATLKCAGCHPKDFKLAPDSHSKATWAKGHGKTDISTCQKCHFDERRFCLDCHGMPMPHVKGWGDTHGDNKPLLNLCGKCHEQQHCDNCHDE